ncbi:MAG: ATP-binding protein [Bacteroidia bacterium]|nr:MAG: ATP-binding protein [Bacteroidia bacterium]
MVVPSIHLRNVSKRFNKHFLYKDLSFDILPKEKVVVIGNNGSGKSTLLKIIIGYISPSSGDVKYIYENREIERKNWYKFVSVAAPYMGLIEDFTLHEIIDHVFCFRQYQVSKNEMIELLGLEKHLYKQIKHYSSGMKQKLRLLLAIMDRSPILLLDEPTTNLDAMNIQWYSNMIEKWAAQKTIIVFSNNVKEEFYFCERKITL